MKARSLVLAVLTAMTALSGAQTWSRAYEQGLSAARNGKWAAAREAFQRAAADRPDDRSLPTNLPGPATERKTWRNGAPYSPNFLAAYALYRQAIATNDSSEAASELKTSATELESLVAKDQGSAEAFFFLDLIYARLGDTTKRQAAADRFAKMGRKSDFRADTEVIAPEELAAMQAQTANPGTTPPANPNNPGAQPVVTPPPPGRIPLQPTPAGAVPALPNKFALIIGQSETRLSGGALPFGATDAVRIHDALVSSAGYANENVEVLQNATAADIKTAANALAARMSDQATVFVFFAGAGVNLNGKDYLAGVDTEAAGDVSSMIGKRELLEIFVHRGARIFSFFEASRPMDANGFYFGKELISNGSISQVMGTRSSENVGALYREGQPIGVFANALVQTLNDLRSNRIPIFDFTWQVFYAMRRGESGTTGGGGTQVCVLPQLANLAADARF